jgi:hypothetical protein
MGNRGMVVIVAIAVLVGILLCVILAYEVGYAQAVKACANDVVDVLGINMTCLQRCTG